MGNCSNHRKDLFGQTDMRHVAEDIGNLHYNSLMNLLRYLSEKLQRDAWLDFKAGRKNLGSSLANASRSIEEAHRCIKSAWKISEPFMIEQPLGNSKSNPRRKKNNN